MPRATAIILLTLGIALAGCSAPPEAERATPPNATASDDDANASAAPDEPLPLTEGENADMRVRIADHHADAASTSMVLRILNKGGDELLIRYAELDNERGGSFYFELNARIPAGEERTVTVEDSSGDTDERLAPWTELRFYYTRAADTPQAADEALAMDLRGRGLPRE